MPKRIARWNGTAGVWETDERALCGHSELFSETWPTSGWMRGGSVFALPTWEPPISGTASSLLPTFVTPTAQLAVNGGSQHPDKRKAGGHGPTLADQVEHLLPTPTSRDHKDGRPSDVPINALLGRAVWELIPEE